MPRRGWREWITRIALSLLAGAVINVAVAWAIAAWMPLKASALSGAPEPTFPVGSFTIIAATEYAGPGWRRRHWSCEGAWESRKAGPFQWCIINVGKHDIQLYQPLMERAFRGWGRLTIPFQVVIDNDSRNPASPTLLAWQRCGLEQDGLEHATGWPLPALWYSISERPSAPGSLPPMRDGVSQFFARWHIDEPIFEHSSADAKAFAKEFVVEGGIAARIDPVMQRRSFGLGTCVRVLPLIPIARGFLIDSLFWGVLSVPLWIGLGALMRWNRLRRGLCPRCAYSLAGLPSPTCPECGWKPRNRGESAEPVAGGS